MMMDYICRETARLIKKYDETDPFRLAEAMNIRTRCLPMTNEPDCCKGFLVKQDGLLLITVNADLPKRLRQFICAHELGHCVLHTDDNGVLLFRDFDLYNEISIAEYEANLFAAELLLSDDDVLEAVSETEDFFSAASALSVPPEFLDFKFRMLKHKGYDLEAPIVSDSRFLKNVEVYYDTEF